MPNREPEERFAVWEALSEFFLDTELGTSDYERIATILMRSGYSLDELRDILNYEVYPACKGNMLSVAGEWAGFRPDWIMQHIAPLKNKRPMLSFGHFVNRWMFQSHWDRVSNLINETPK